MLKDRKSDLFKKISILLFIFILLAIIPSSFAINPENVDVAMDSDYSDTISLDSQNSYDLDDMAIDDSGKLSSNLENNLQSSNLAVDNGKIQTNLSDKTYNDIKSAVDDEENLGEYTIYIGEGTYTNSKSGDYDLESGEQNTQIRVINKSIAFIGAGKDKTFIDGTNTDWLFNLSNSNVTFKDLTFINAYADSASVIYSSNGNLNLINCTIRDNAIIGDSSSSKSPVYFEGYYFGRYDLVIKDSLFENDTAGNSGGAISISRAYADISNTSFIGNTAKYGEYICNGGAVYLSGNNHMVSFDGCDFVNSTGKNGGSIYSYYGGNFSVFNCQFINSTASAKGGAIYAEEGNFQYTKVYLYLANNTFENCIANGTEENIFTTGINVIDLGGNASIIMDDIEVTVGEDSYLPIQIVDMDGNPISADLELVLNNSKHQYNQTVSFTDGHYNLSLKDYEVGIYNLTATLISPDYTTLPSKSTVKIHATYAYALIVEPEEITLQEGESFIVTATAVDEYNEKTNAMDEIQVWIIWETYEGTIRTLTGSYKIQNGILNFDLANLEMIPIKRYEITFEPQFSYDWGDVESGVMHVNMIEVLPDNYTDIDIIYVDALNGDDASGNGTEENPVKSLVVALNMNDALGGGKTVFIKEGTYDVTAFSLKSDVTVIGEDSSKVIITQPSGNRGMFFLREGIDVKFENITFTGGNTTIVPYGAVFSNYYNSRLILNNSIFHNNKGWEGGVINNNDNGTVIIDNCDFHDNHAYSAGVLYSSAGFIYIYNSNFTGNAAQYVYNENRSVNGTGGALALHTDTHTVIENCNFINNSAPSDNNLEGGGAIALSCLYPAQINNCTFINNYAGRFGGAIWAPYGIIDIYGCVFINNSAKGEGSVLASYYNNDTIINITNSVIISNGTMVNELYVPDESETILLANYNWWGSNRSPSVANANTSLRVVMTFINDEDDNLVVSLNTLNDGSSFVGYLPIRTVVFTPAENFEAAIVNLTDNTVTVSYNGDLHTDVITATIDKQTLTFKYQYYPEIPTSIEIDEITAVADSTVTLVARVSSEGVTLNTGEVSFYIGNELIGTSPVVDGVASLEYTAPSDVGIYDVTVVYSGDEEYKPSTSTASLNVTDQIKTSITIESSDLFVGEKINVKLMDSTNNGIAGKTLTITISGDKTDEITKVTDENGIVSLDLSAGNYQLFVKFAEDESYLASNNTFVVSISKFTTNISIENEKNDVIFKLMNGTAPLSNKVLNVSVLDGKGQLTVYDLTTNNQGIASITLDVGNYLVGANFAGDSVFKNSSQSEYISIDESDVVEKRTGADIQALIDAANPGDVIDLENYTYVNVSNVNITKNITIISSNATLIIGEDADYAFNIAPISQGGPQEVTLSDMTFVLDNGDSVVKITADNSTNPNAIDVAKVNIELNIIRLANEDVVGESVSVLELQSERGILATTNELRIVGNTIDAGIKPFEFTLISGDGNSDVIIPAGPIAPEKKATVIEYKDMTTTAVDTDSDGRIGEYFKVVLKDVDGNILAGKAVQIGFNGKIYNRTTDENGSCQLQINLVRSDIYTFAVSFLGDNEYNGTFVVAKITVNKQKPSLTVPNKSYKASATTKTLTATFKSAKGNAVANKKVTFTVNGKTYSATTNANGVASVKVSLSTKKTYSFTVKFAGDGTYDAITKTAKVTIT